MVSQSPGLEEHGWTKRCRHSRTFGDIFWKGRTMRWSAYLGNFIKNKPESPLFTTQ